MARDNNCSASQYLERICCEKDDELDFADSLLSEYERKIHIVANEGRMLQFFIQSHDVKRIIEIGTLAGHSAIYMARALPEDGKIFTIEKDEERFEKAKKAFAQCDEVVKSKIHQLQGDAIDILRDIRKDAPFDMVFIDANKSGYCDYLSWAEENIEKGGLIIADNVFLFGNVFLDKPANGVSIKSFNIMREFNLRIMNKKRYNSFILQTQEGMAIATKKF